MAEPHKNSCNSKRGAGIHNPSLHPLHHHHHHHLRRHHHIFYVSPNCPLHRPISQPNNHSPSCSFSSYHLSAQYPRSVSTTLPDPNLSFSDLTNGTFHGAPMAQDEIKEPEVEEEEEPMFVLTDEWREFFAKSEAKRRLAKKQVMKKGKN